MLNVLTKLLVELSTKLTSFILYYINVHQRQFKSFHVGRVIVLNCFFTLFFIQVRHF